MTSAAPRAPFPIPTPDAIVGDPARVHWRRVGLFLLIALGGGWVIGFIQWRIALAVPPGFASLVTLSLAVVYMPLPLVAGLIVEKRAHRRILLARAWNGLRSHPRRIGVIALVGIVPTVAVVVAAFGVTWLLSLAGVPGAGTLVTSAEELAQQLGQLTGTELPAAAVAALPAPGVLALVSLVQGVVAGATINAVFALGEEYGWRGVLAEELAPWGVARANAFIGTVWGLWHAPIIIWLGHNYGAQWGWGVPMMVVLCVPFGFVLAWAAARGGVFAAAVGHGVFNGTLGVTTLMFLNASPLVAPPGVAVGIAGTVVAAVLWLAWPPGGRRPSGSLGDDALRPGDHSARP